MYISGGDIYMQQEDGSWQIPRKPEAVQEALWQDIYRSGGQENYLPWSDDGTGATITDRQGLVDITLRNGAHLRFTQPLNNVYVKLAKVAVSPLLGVGSTEEPQHVAQYDSAAISIAWQDGSIYQLHRWRVSRLTSADLDRQSHGRDLNPIMNFLLSDISLLATVSDLSGRVTWEIAEVRKAYD